MASFEMSVVVMCVMIKVDLRIYLLIFLETTNNKTEAGARFLLRISNLETSFSACS